MRTKEQIKMYQKEYRNKNKDKLKAYLKGYYQENKAKLIIQMKNYNDKTKPNTLEATIKRNLKNIKSKCLSNGVPFDITMKDLCITDTCPLLGIEIKAGLPRNSAQSPSIDKIVPELGYIKGNVWIVSSRANIIKNDASVDEIELLAKNLRNKINEH